METNSTNNIFDIRVRALIKRHRANGIAVWAFLRDAIAAAPADGLLADDTSLAVYADFLPLPPERFREILDLCLTLRLFALTPNGNIVAATPGDNAPGTPAAADTEAPSESAPQAPAAWAIPIGENLRVRPVPAIDAAPDGGGSIVLDF